MFKDECPTAHHGSTSPDLKCSKTNPDSVNLNGSAHRNNEATGQDFGGDQGNGGRGCMMIRPIARGSAGQVLQEEARVNCGVV